MMDRYLRGAQTTLQALLPIWSMPPGSPLEVMKRTDTGLFPEVTTTF
ncbi:MAG: hypothetical protein AAF327_15400 [Cyanobacteria bacterium P01_A01_bin.37]